MQPRAVELGISAEYLAELRRGAARRIEHERRSSRLARSTVKGIAAQARTSRGRASLRAHAQHERREARAHHRARLRSRRPRVGRRVARRVTGCASRGSPRSSDGDETDLARSSGFPSFAFGGRAG
jgi:hypothetical protein